MDKERTDLTLDQNIIYYLLTISSMPLFQLSKQNQQFLLAFYTYLQQNPNEQEVYEYFKQCCQLSSNEPVFSNEELEKKKKNEKTLELIANSRWN